VPEGGELTTQEAKSLIDDLAAVKAPAILFSGGEPTLREDLQELMAHAVSYGIRPTISTNGMLIDAKLAEQFRQAGVAYVGISLDGLKATHDAFRRCNGAFERALEGVAHCRAAGVKVGLRMTLSALNHTQVPAVFDLLVQHDIQRICFYHLVYSGRGAELLASDLTAAQRRDVLDVIIDRTEELHRPGKPVEVLTVDNHADGPYLYLRLLQRDPVRAEKALELLQRNRGNASGVRLVCVKSNGDVYPDQFWQTQLLGNLRQRRFADIWNDAGNELLRRLRQFPRSLSGPRCANCRWLGICNGNFRSRAEAITGDVWGDDPSCQLSDEEIGIATPAAALKQR
jgi:radical SAM protein with 4Fe4S-binding SPASM domain